MKKVTFMFWSTLKFFDFSFFYLRIDDLKVVKIDRKIIVLYNCESNLPQTKNQEKRAKTQ